MIKFYVEPLGNIAGFTEGTAYPVLATAVDNNNQPVFAVPNNERAIKNVPAERLRFVPEDDLSMFSDPGYVEERLRKGPEEVDVDYEVVDDGPIETGIEDPEEEQPEDQERAEPKKTTGTKGRPKSKKTK